MTQANSVPPSSTASDPLWWDQENSQDAAPAPSVETDMPTYGERLLATVAHLCSVLNFFVPVLGAMLVLGILYEQSHRSEFVRAHVQEAIAFQLVYAVSLVSIAAVLFGQFYCIPLVPVLIVLGLYYNLAGAMSAWHGESFRYPFTSELIQWWMANGGLKE